MLLLLLLLDLGVKIWPERIITAPVLLVPYYR
jgi:hypothetical protein